MKLSNEIINDLSVEPQKNRESATAQSLVIGLAPFLAPNHMPDP